MRPEASQLLQVILMLFTVFYLFEHIVGRGIFYDLIHLFYCWLVFINISLP